MRQFFRNNGLSLVLFGMFLLSLAGQSVSGMQKYNNDQQDHGNPPVSYAEYLASEDFLEATAENWESEFLQLFTFVLLTRFLYQKGSPQSMDPDAPEEKEPNTPEEKLPWPVKRGGLTLKLYEHSLSITFLLLFIVSIAMHAVGGVGEYNQEQLDHGQRDQLTAWGYLGTSTFWFESLQNWQSEFLALFAVVFLSIWLRERNSPESKEVHAPYDQTGR